MGDIDVDDVGEICVADVLGDIGGVSTSSGSNRKLNIPSHASCEGNRKVVEGSSIQSSLQAGVETALLAVDVVRIALVIASAALPPAALGVRIDRPGDGARELGTEAGGDGAQEVAVDMGGEWTREAGIDDGCEGAQEQAVEAIAEGAWETVVEVAQESVFFVVCDVRQTRMLLLPSLARCPSPRLRCCPVGDPFLCACWDASWTREGEEFLACWLAK